MLQHKPLSQIGLVDHGWLQARLHFAIGGHGNPAHQPLGALFVFNDDEIAPGAGFPMHPHADIEIVTYVRDGIVTHEDSLGNKGHTKAGDVQVMSTGTGIRHAEYNEHDVPARLFQIWLWPRARGGAPQVGTRSFPQSGFVALASGYDALGALAIRSDAEVHGAQLSAGTQATFEIRPGHSVYLVPASGSVRVGDKVFTARDGLIVRDEPSIVIEALADVEVILIMTVDPG